MSVPIAVRIVPTPQLKTVMNVPAPAVVRMIQGGPRGDTGPAGSTVQTKNFLVSGDISVASGSVDFIPPAFMTVRPGESLALQQARYVLQTGGTATFKVQHNGIDVPGFTNLTADTTPASVTAGPIPMADGDLLAIIVTGITGVPENLTVELVLF